jgi:hypothetical protein
MPNHPSKSSEAAHKEGKSQGGATSPPPPPSDPTRENRDEDKDDLIGALDRLRIVLDDVVNGPEPLVSPELRVQFSVGWLRVKDAFTNLTSWIQDNDNVPQLRAVGLTGASLRLKVAGLRRAFTRLLSGAAAPFHGRLRNFLAWGNTILGSLASVFQAVEVIKEYKECIENDLADQDAKGL